MGLDEKRLFCRLGVAAPVALIALLDGPVQSRGVLTRDEHITVTAWIRAEYGDRTAAVIGAAPRTTGLALRIRLESLTMWLRGGGVVDRSLDNTEHEGLVANELRAAGVPLPAVIPKADGTFAGRLHLGETELLSIAYAELGGTEVQEPNRQQAEALGVSLRRLHDATLSPTARALPKVEPLRGVDTRLSEARKWLTISQARDLTAVVETALERVQSVPLPSCVCHGDIRYANVRYDDHRPTLFDLEALGLGPPLYDLACMWRRRIVETGMAGVPEDWRWFRRGYEMGGTLGRDGWSLIPALACLRAFWTMTLPIEPRATWGEAYKTSPEYWQAHMMQMGWFGAAMLSGSSTV
jgi:Ser/Thr protein kinase RdoA (MazF antagonist)